MKYPRTLYLCLLLCLSFPTICAAQSGGSQILIARHSDTIVVGEVIYLGKSPYDSFSTLALPSTQIAAIDQLVILRVVERIKGRYSQKLIKVSVSFSVESLTNPLLSLKENRKYILLVQKSQGGGNCEESVDLRYRDIPCYRITRGSIIPATPEEIEAAKWLASHRQKMTRR